MLSIVVCTRNRNELLSRCLEALASQEGSFEVLIVDQGDTPALIPIDPRFRRIASRELGLSAARNQGVRAAMGNVIAFLDDDSVPDPGYVPAIEKAFDEDPNLSSVAGRILTLEDARPYARVHDSIPRELGRGNWLRFMGGNFAIRCEVADEVGPFDERFGAGCRWASGEETDYFFRMMYKHRRVAYVPTATVRHPREEVDAAPRELRTKLLAYARGQGAVIARHLIEFGNYQMLIVFIWGVVKSCLRAAQYAFFLQPRPALLHGSVAIGKWTGFIEFLKTSGRERKIAS
jgi:glycosyltransferase involved in cell wall biosynthesis